MTKFHPACRDNFAVFAFHRTIVTLFLPYLAAFRNNFHPGNRASPVVSVYMKNFHPGKRDLASFKQYLANRACPLVPYKRTVIVIRKRVARRDLAYRAVSLSGPARLPYKQPLRRYLHDSISYQNTISYFAFAILYYNLQQKCCDTSPWFDT